MKKERAYIRKQEKHQHKEWGKFQSIYPKDESQTQKVYSTRNSSRQKRNTKRSQEWKVNTGLDKNEHQLILNFITYLEKKMLLEAQADEKTKRIELSYQHKILLGRDERSKLKWIV